LAEAPELVEGRGIVRRLAGDEIALVKSGERVYAFVNVCPHRRSRLVDKYGGQISRHELTCPTHGWTYDLQTGESIDRCGKLRMLEAKIENGIVLVNESAKGAIW